MLVETENFPLMMGFPEGSGFEERDATDEFEGQFPSMTGYTEAEEKKLVRKIDLLLLPTIFLMYLLSYMDRTKYDFFLLYLAISKARARCN